MNRLGRVLLTVVVLVGCGGPTSATPSPSAAASSPLPPRPRELPLDKVTPCAILTPSQLQRLGVGTPTASTAGEGPLCQWDRFPEEPQDGYTIAPDLGRGAEYALASITDVRVIEVAGFAAVESQQTVRPDKHCLLAVDVAAGQNLFVRYDYFGSTVPMTKQLACDKAAVAATMAIETLTELAAG